MTNTKVTGTPTLQDRETILRDCFVASITFDIAYGIAYGNDEAMRGVMCAVWCEWETEFDA